MSYIQNAFDIAPWPDQHAYATTLAYQVDAHCYARMYRKYGHWLGLLETWILFAKFKYQASVLIKFIVDRIMVSEVCRKHYSGTKLELVAQVANRGVPSFVNHATWRGATVMEAGFDG